MTRRVFRDWAPEPETHHPTRDLQPSLHSQVFANEKIGTSRYRTPEGYLFCEAVPIARTAEMVYGPNEVPVRPGLDGLVHISRTPATLFHADTLRSFHGKAITNDHPDGLVNVNPKNHRELSVGTVLNPRRGTGDKSDLMLADFLVTDAETIAAIEEGKVEVSCGYDALYEEISLGKGLQTDIVGNHVALVDRGRCGQRCAIGDRNPLEEDDEMRTRDNAPAAPATETTAQRARRQFNDIGKTLDELDASGNGTNVHVHLGGPAPVKTEDADPVAKLTKDMGMMAQSIAALTQSVSLLVKGKKASRAADDDGSDKEDDNGDETTATGDAEGDEEDDEEKKPKKKTEDSKALLGSFKDTAAGVEVLVPGMRLPTFDSAVTRAKTVDSMCRMRSAALDRFGATPQGKQILSGLTAGKGFEPLTTDCKATAALFKDAVAAQKQAINAGNTNGSHQMATHDGVGGQPQFGVTVVQGVEVSNKHSVAAVAARHAAHWKKLGVNV